jgi:hypothetical protein
MEEHVSFGDFGDFGSWTPEDHALSEMVFDKAYKGGGTGGGGGDSNSGCGVVFAIIIVGIF